MASLIIKSHHHRHDRQVLLKSLIQFNICRIACERLHGSTASPILGYRVAIAIPYLSLGWHPIVVILIHLYYDSSPFPYR